MPLANAVPKTASAPSRLRILIAAAVFLLLILAAWLTKSASYTLKTKSQTYQLEAATTSADQAKGLGDRTSLADNRGMLFIFNDQQVRCFWMKDMHFSLDIIWLNQTKQVIHIEPNLSPATYPHAYCPAGTAKYVIEINAGQVQAAHITLGQTLQF